MKKLVVVLLVLFCMAFVFAQTNDTGNDTITTSSTTTTQQNQSKIQTAFTCLEDKVAGKCSTLSLQEISLTILATPKNSVLDECVNALKDKKRSENCWGTNGCNIKETALAILALNHMGENTDAAENWLLAQNKTPVDLVWYLEQDSNEASECHISYDSNDYTVNVNENKKISANAGTCLTRAQANFWLKVSPSCLNKEFRIECDKNFISTLLYKNQNSPTIYVLEDTESSPAFGTISLQVKSKCFSTSSSCDYEATAWATLALLKTRHNVEEFIPYVVALADTNARYLPDAFIFMVTSYEDYGNKLIAEQKLGNYWEASSSAYNKYYDTALALLSLGDSSSDNVIKARDWALFSQGNNGCWGNSIRDTAIMLWALEGRTGRATTGTSVTTCSEGNYFCIPTAECPSGEVLNNYFCSGLSSVCCQNENLQTCSEYSGVVCTSDQVCTGNERRASDEDACCLGTCEDKPTETECESIGYLCKAQCTDSQEEVGYSCNSGDVCCRTKTTPTGGSSFWLWFFIILILIILIVLAYIYRERLKLFWHKVKNKFKKDKSKGEVSSNNRPRPGFPPAGMPMMRRPMPMRRMPIMPPQRRQMPRPEDRAMDETFKKLKEMSK